MLLREPSGWIFDSKLLVSGWLALAVQLGGQSSRDYIVVANCSFLSVDRLIGVSGRPLALFLHVLIKLYSVLLLVSVMQDWR
jgi:hypothetical protein